MCGIAGYLQLAPGQRPDLGAMTDALAHRGPDGRGVAELPGVGFGHRRLAIIDLSEGGHQPMRSADGRLLLTYNGEIYNYRELRDDLTALGHRFRSASDTEVILHAYQAWGDACIGRFNGMFAFALWDAERRRLFCARDRLGVKPFVYMVKGGLFLFASEPKGILAVAPEERRIDHATLHRYLTRNRLGDGERTFYAAIRQLPAAHALTVEDGVPEVRRYWDYPAADPDLAARPSGELGEHFRTLFLDAVRLRARSDVEVGTTLSGGLDSASIVAAFRHLFPGQPHKGFSAVFPGHHHDEGPAIRAVAARYGVDLHVVEQSADGLARDMAALVRHLDAPLISPAPVPLLRVMRTAQAAGVKVLYDGQGADELLAGYDVQLYPPYLHSLAREGRAGALFGALGGLTRRRAVWLARYLLPDGAHRLYQRGIAADAALTPGFAAAGTPEPTLPRRYADPLNDALWRLHAHTTLPGLLHYGDAVSMACSIEYRAPFLDYRLVEFGFRLPAREKIAGGVTKAILRRAMAGLLMDEVRLNRVKIGFDTPLGAWLGREPQVLNDAFADSAVRRHGIFDAAAVRRAAERLRGGEHGLERYVMRWLGAQMWITACIDGRG